jgi:hypothetical protein
MNSEVPVAIRLEIGINFVRKDSGTRWNLKEEIFLLRYLMEELLN